MHDLTEDQKRAQEADRQAREATIQMMKDLSEEKRKEDEERLKRLESVQEPTEQEPTEKERTVSLSASVPQSLKERIDALRQSGNGFNVSEFVTAVLLKKIDREEELASIQKPLIAHLRREKYNNADWLENMARDQARKDAKNLNVSLAEFRAIDALDLSEITDPEQLTHADENEIGYAAESVLARLDLEHDSERLTFLCAYFQELQAVWDEIKDEV